MSSINNQGLADLGTWIESAGEKLGAAIGSPRTLTLAQGIALAGRDIRLGLEALAQALRENREGTT